MAWLLVAAMFLAAFWFGPWAQLENLRLMPGDVIDNRLENYFLENIWMFIQGNSSSLWHLGFFAPFPWILGFADNLFGASPVYLAARWVGADSSASFQIWFLFSYAANYAGCYYALRKLGQGSLPAAVGALVFTFALPATAQAGHAQLAYRFAVPPAMAMMLLFLKGKNLRDLAFSVGWTVWQFYCSIYMGFFTLLLLLSLVFAWACVSLWAGRRDLRHSIARSLTFGRNRIASGGRGGLVALVIFAALLGLLFFPYARANAIYGTKRGWEEIATMLPRPGSYLLADASSWWQKLSAKVTDIPMRHEHQMFVGLFPVFLATLGTIALARGRAPAGSDFPLLIAALVIPVAATLFLARFSPWSLFIGFPVFSGVRSVTRIILALLFPVAFLASVGTAILLSARSAVGKAAVAASVLLMVAEFSSAKISVSPKSEWNKRLAEADARLPDELADDSIVFFAQNQSDALTASLEATEVDAMFVALNRGLSTMNGYPIFLPPGCSAVYGDDSSEMVRRVLGYLAFTGGSDADYQSLMRRIVPVGFDALDPRWASEMPSCSKSFRVYSPEEIRDLSIACLGLRKTDEGWKVDLQITNHGKETICRASDLGKPVRLVWRFLDSSSRPVSGWDHRRDLPFDLRAGESLKMIVPVGHEDEVRGGTLVFSLVQEQVFSGDEIGFPPTPVAWR